MADGAANSTVADAPAAWLVWSLRLLSFAAAGIAGYLLYVSLTEGALPAGCGQGSGCSEVLTSQWSAVFGIPVSAPAIAVYGTFLVATFFIGAAIPPGVRSLAWKLILALSAAIIAAALWFIGVQLFDLKAICPWCMAEHAIGIVLAILVLPKAFAAIPRMPIRASATALGVASVLAMVGTQFLVPHKPTAAVRLPPGQNADTGPGPDRLLSVLSGDVHIAPHDEPHLGSADAPKQLAVLFDYCCPHCRATHGYLIEGMTRYPNQFGVVLLPSPLDAKCNKHIELTDDRFQHACELATLALAVWRAKPTAFGEFDAWLFEPEMPRDPQEARRKAEELVSAAALDKSLTDPWVTEHLTRNTDAYARCKALSKIDRLPIIMSPGFATVVGRPGSQEELFEALEKELSLAPTGE